MARRKPRNELVEYHEEDHLGELPTGPLKREEILALRRIIRSDDRMRWFWSSARIWAGWLLGVPAAIVATWQLLKLFGIWGSGPK
jgi:hypothetical protein